MRDWKNFYFWSSWILLAFCFFLIFCMYQSKFKFQDVIDVKTILTVIGTLGGAFLGAYFAGRYSTNQVSRQLKHQVSMTENEKLEASLKYASVALVVLQTAHLNLKDTLEIFQLETDNDEFAGEIQFALPLFQKNINEIKSLNLINVVGNEMYFSIYRCTMMTEHVSDMLTAFQYNSPRSYRKDNLEVRKLMESFERAISTYDKFIPKIEEELRKDLYSKENVTKILEKI